MSDVGELPGGLDALNAARLADGRQILAGLEAEYAALVEAARAESYDAVRDADWHLGEEGPATRALDEWGVTDRLAALSAEQARCLLFALAERLSGGGQEHTEPARWLYWLTRRPLGLVVGDVRLLAALAEPGAKSRGYQPFEYVVDIVEDLQRAAGSGPRVRRRWPRRLLIRLWAGTRWCTAIPKLTSCSGAFSIRRVIPAAGRPSCGTRRSSWQGGRLRYRRWKAR